jgi:hypothetical protein
VNRWRNAWPIIGIASLVAAARWLVMTTPANFAGWLPASWFTADNLGTTRLCLSASVALLFLVVLALLLLRRWAGPGTSVADQLGVRAPDLAGRSSWWVLAGFFVGAAGLGLLAPWVSDEIAAAYPLDWHAGRSPLALLRTELLVLVLIAATEIFYRGMVVRLLHDRVGVLAIYISAAIYTLDHIGAPRLELYGSAVAGILLGYLATTTRSIWPGFIAHATCAIGVDLSALWTTSRLWFQD